MLEWIATLMSIMEREDAILADERPHLIVLRGPSLGDFFALEGDDLVLGSDPFRADIVIRDVEVSSRHARRSEEHTSELQSRQYLVCRLLLEKKKNIKYKRITTTNELNMHSTHIQR